MVDKAIFVITEGSEHNFPGVLYCVNCKLSILHQTYRVFIYDISLPIRNKGIKVIYDPFPIFLWRPHNERDLHKMSYITVTGEKYYCLGFWLSLRPVQAEWSYYFNMKRRDCKGKVKCRFHAKNKRRNNVTWMQPISIIKTSKLFINDTTWNEKKPLSNPS